MQRCSPLSELEAGRAPVRLGEPLRPVHRDGEGGGHAEGDEARRHAGPGGAEQAVRRDQESVGAIGGGA